MQGKVVATSSVVGEVRDDGAIRVDGAALPEQLARSFVASENDDTQTYRLKLYDVAYSSRRSVIGVYDRSSEDVPYIFLSFV